MSSLSSLLRRSLIAVVGLSAAAVPLVVLSGTSTAQVIHPKTTAAIGTAVVLNPTGGHGTTSGLRIFYKGGEFQVVRDNLPQFYSPYGGLATPTNPTNATVSTSPTSLDNGILLSIGTKDTATGVMVYPKNELWGTYYASDPFKKQTWTTISTTKYTRAATKFTSQLSATVNGLTYKVKITVSYTFPDDTFTITYHLTVPVGNTKPVRLYHVMDTFLGGSDVGPGFYDAATACHGQIVGVSSSTSTTSTVMAIVQKSGTTWEGYISNYWGFAVYGTKFFTNFGARPNTVATAHPSHHAAKPAGTTTYGAGFGVALNDTITTNPGNDNGIGINYGPVTSGTLTVTDQFYFSATVPTCTNIGASTNASGSTTTPPASDKATTGYYQVGADGGVYAFGDAYFYGSLPERGITPAAPIVGITTTPDHKGYWLIGADGGVFAFGDAWNYGSLPERAITPSSPIVGLVRTVDGEGYWLVGADGGVYAFGDALYWGSLPEGGITPAQSIVAMISTPTDLGYWLVGADGGVYAFGDAYFYGSLPERDITPTAPIVGVARSAQGKGYWLLSADGGVYSFGNAPFRGSLSERGIAPYGPAVGFAGTDNREGYWLASADGGVYAFGDAYFQGSLPRLEVTPHKPITGIAAW